MGGAITDIKADALDTYEEGHALLAAELDDDVYADPTDGVHTATAGRQDYHFGSARPGRISSGRVAMFRQPSNDVELESSDLKALLRQTSLV